MHRLLRFLKEDIFFLCSVRRWTDLVLNACLESDIIYFLLSSSCMHFAKSYISSVVISKRAVQAELPHQSYQHQLRHIHYLASEVMWSECNFVYISTTGGMNFLGFLHRTKEAGSQSWVIIYVTLIPSKSHLCGLLAFYCHKKWWTSHVMFQIYRGLFFSRLSITSQDST